MKLSINCKSCRTSNSIKSSAMTRPEFAKYEGEEFNLNCTSCGVNQKIHVNEVRATATVIPVILGVGISIIFTLFLLGVLGAIASVSFAIPIYIWRQQQINVSGWNKYRL